jgi:hypothetical protein
MIYKFISTDYADEINYLGSISSKISGGKIYLDGLTVITLLGFEISLEFEELLVLLAI